MELVTFIETIEIVRCVCERACQEKTNNHLIPMTSKFRDFEPVVVP